MQHRRRRAIANKLWIARKRAGYPQKWVAALLGTRSLSVISEYERGRKLPSLAAALKLELIYQTPLVELYPILYAKLATEVARAREDHLPLRQHEEKNSNEFARPVAAPIFPTGRRMLLPRTAVQSVPCQHLANTVSSPSLREHGISASPSLKAKNSSDLA